MSRAARTAPDEPPRAARAVTFGSSTATPAARTSASSSSTVSRTPDVAAGSLSAPASSSAMAVSSGQTRASPPARATMSSVATAPAVECVRGLSPWPQSASHHGLRHAARRSDGVRRSSSQAVRSISATASRCWAGAPQARTSRPKVRAGPRGRATAVSCPAWAIASTVSAWRNSPRKTAAGRVGCSGSRSLVDSHSGATIRSPPRGGQKAPLRSASSCRAKTLRTW